MMQADQAVAYVRSSTKRQTGSLKRQRQSIQRWADSLGVNIVAWHVDHGVSATKPISRRPGLRSALNDLASTGAGLLLVESRDRLVAGIDVGRAIDARVRECGAVVGYVDESDPSSPTFKLHRAMRSLLERYAQQVAAS